MSEVLACYDQTFAFSGFSPEQIQELRRDGMEAGVEQKPLMEFRLQARASYFSLFVDDGAVVSEQTWPLVKQILWNRIHARIMVAFPELVFLKADAVVWRRNVILLPGRSFSGKSTLALALVELGCQMWARSFCALDMAGTVYPFPRKQRPADGLPVGGIFDLTYVPNHPWSASSLSAGQAALALTSVLATSGESPGAFLPRVAAICSKAVARFQGKRGDASSSARYLLAEMDASLPVASQP